MIIKEITIHILSANPPYTRAYDDGLWQIIDKPKYVMTDDNFKYRMYAKQIRSLFGSARNATGFREIWGGVSKHLWALKSKSS